MGRGRKSAGRAGSRPGAKKSGPSASGGARGPAPRATEGDRRITAEIKQAVRHADRLGLTLKGSENVVIARLRDHVEERLGPIESTRFDRLVKTERAKGKLSVEAAGDSRAWVGYTQRDHDRAIPGMGSQSPFMYLYRPRRGRENKAFNGR